MRSNKNKNLRNKTGKKTNSRARKAKVAKITRHKPVKKARVNKKTLHTRPVRPKHANTRNSKPEVKRKHSREKSIVQKKTASESSGRKRANVSIPKPDEVKDALDSLFSNDHAIEYLRKNVSKMAVDVIGMLVTPKTDEYLAEELGTKINAIRRILNIMQGYGITNYYISKNTKGWLSFAWYINTSKLPPFLEYVEGMEREKSIVNDACNDYFVCEDCYKSDRFVFTFDSAFENSFRCNNCGNSLNRMDRTEAELLVNNGKKSIPTSLKPN